MTFSGRGCILTAVKNACAGNAIRFANNIYHLNGFLVAEGGVQGRPLDARGRNITANVVQPGVMPTDMSAEVFGENVSDAVLDQHPIRRIATLEEVAALVCFLAGPQGGYITGEVISVSGGIGL